MAGDVTGEVFEWREDLEETEEVSLRGRAFPGSLKAINLRTAWGLSAPGKKKEQKVSTNWLFPFLFLVWAIFDPF